MSGRRNDVGAWMIKFTFKDGWGEPIDVLYAGEAGGAMGWAPTPATASVFATREIAERMAVNGYHLDPDTAEYEIVEAPEK